MSIPVATLTAAALEAIKLYATFAARAADMTDEEATAEWARVNANAANADAMWERSKVIRAGQIGGPRPDAFPRQEYASQFRGTSEESE